MHSSRPCVFVLHRADKRKKPYEKFLGMGHGFIPGMVGSQHWRSKVHRHTPMLSGTVSSVRQYEFSDLFDRNTQLSGLATGGVYTVVEVYSDSCGYCRELEAGFSDFQKKRPDVTLARIHVPEQIQFKVAGHTLEEQQKSAEELNAKIKAYNHCGTPHVEVYGPDLRELARDHCGQRAGTGYLWDWITAETGLRPRETVGG